MTFEEVDVFVRNCSSVRFGWSCEVEASAEKQIKECSRNMENLGLKPLTPFTGWGDHGEEGEE